MPEYPAWEPSGAYAPHASEGGPARLVALGDSITIAGDTLTYGSEVRSDSYPLWLTLASEGTVQFLRNAGVGGNKSSDMIDRFDTDVTPYKPTVVSVMAGTNDFTFGVTLSQYQANIKTLISMIQQIGAVPVIFGSPPINSYAGTSTAQEILYARSWLALYCASQGVPFVDTYAQVCDPTSDGLYLATMTGDGGTHPSTLGYYTIGQAAWQQLKGIFGAKLPFTSPLNKDPNNLLSNGLFLTYTGSNGIGDGWTADETPTGGTYSTSLVANSAFPGGQAQELSLSATTSGNLSIYQNVSTPGPPLVYSPGDTLSLSAMVTTTGNAGFEIAIADGVTGDYTLVEAYGGTVTNAIVQVPDWQAPSNTPDFLKVQLFAKSQTSGTTTGTVQFGAVTLYNRTTGQAVGV